jgi:hypothetical protein
MTVPTVPTTPTTTKTPQTVVDASASTFVRTLTAVITVLGGLSSLGGIVLSAIHQGSSGPDIALIAGGSLLALVANLTAGIHHNAIANMISNLAKSGELSTILGDAVTVLKGADPALVAAVPPTDSGSSDYPVVP